MDKKVLKVDKRDGQTWYYVQGGIVESNTCLTKSLKMAYRGDEGFFNLIIFFLKKSNPKYEFELIDHA